MSKLHIICGNCGCNDSFTYRITKEEVNIKGEYRWKKAVYILCKNCSTLHPLDNNAKKVNS